MIKHSNQKNNQIKFLDKAKSALIFFFALAFAGGAWAEGASPRKILVNFNSTQGMETSLGTWNDMSGNAGTNVALVYSEGTEETGATITWSARDVWKASNTASVLNGYLDDNNGGVNQRITITVENVPFPFYDVVIASAADNGAGFTAKTVNEVVYTYDATAGKVVVTTNPKASWGDNSNRATIEEGVNAITIPAVSGSTLAIASVANNVGNNAVNVPRGNIALIEIIERLDVVADISGEDNVWTTTSFAGTDYKGVQYHQANIAEAGATLTVAEDVQAQGLSVVGGPLTISGNTVEIAAGGVVRVEDGASLAATESSGIVFANGGAIANAGTLTSAITVQSGELWADRAVVTALSKLTLGENAFYNYGTSASTVPMSNLAGSGRVMITSSATGHAVTFNLTGSDDFTGALEFGSASGSAVPKLNAAMTLNRASELILPAGTWIYGENNACTVTANVTARGNLQTSPAMTYKKDLSVGGNLTAERDVVMDNETATGNVFTFTGTTGSVAGKLYGRNCDFTIGDGVSASTLTVRRLEIGDSGTAGLSKLAVKPNATLKITGDNNTLSSATHYKNVSLILGEWKTASTAVIDGSLLAKDANLCLGDAGASVTVGGILAAKGVGQVCNTGNALTLTLKDNGKLILGNNGILGTQKNNTSITLNSGTVGLSADATSIEKGITVADGKSATFDTQKYAFAADGNSISRGAEGGEINVSGAISGTGNLVKTGAGVLSLTGVNTYTGETSVQQGTLKVSSSLAGRVTVGAGAVFDVCFAADENGEYKLSDGIFAMDSGAKVFVNGTEVAVGENAAFSMETRSGDGTYLVPQNAVARFGGEVYYTVDAVLAAMTATEGASFDDVEILRADVAMPAGYAVYSVTEGDVTAHKIRLAGEVYGIAGTTLFTTTTVVNTAEGHPTTFIKGDTLCITNNATRLKLDHQVTTAVVIDLPNASDIVEIGNCGGYAIAGETVTIRNGVLKLTIDNGDAKVKGGMIVINTTGGLDNYGWVDFVDEDITIESIGNHTILTNNGENQAHIRGTTKLIKSGSGTLTIAATFDTARPVEVKEGLLVLPTTTITTLSGSGKLSIPAGVTITATGAISGQITGAGAIKIAAKNSLGAANLDADWIGSVVLPTLSAPGFLDFNTYGNANSRVVVGVTSGACHINNGDMNFIPTVEFTAPFTVTDGYSDKTITFAEVTGAGNLNFTWGANIARLVPVTITTLVGYEGTIAANSKMATTITKLVWTGDVSEKVKVLNVSSANGQDNVTLSSVVDADGTVLDVTITKEDGADGYGIYIAPKTVATVDPTAGVNTVVVAGEADETAEAIAASVDLAQVVQIPAGATADYLDCLMTKAQYDSESGAWTVTIEPNPARVAAPLVTAFNETTESDEGLAGKLADIRTTDSEVSVAVSNAKAGFYYSVELCDTLGDEADWTEGDRTLATGGTVSVKVPAAPRGASGFFRLRVSFADKPVATSDSL